eukprot:915207_1
MLCVFLILFNSILIGIVGTTTWIMGSEPVRINFGRVVGSYNDTIFLLGGQMALYGIQKFQTTTKRFTYRDDNALPLYTKAFGQGWTQKEHIIYFTQTESKLAMYRMDTEQYNFYIKNVHQEQQCSKKGSTNAKTNAIKRD